MSSSDESDGNSYEQEKIADTSKTPASVTGKKPGPIKRKQPMEKEGLPKNRKKKFLSEVMELEQPLTKKVTSLHFRKMETNIFKLWRNVALWLTAENENISSSSTNAPTNTTRPIVSTLTQSNFNERSSLCYRSQQPRTSPDNDQMALHDELGDLWKTSWIHNLLPCITMATPISLSLGLEFLTTAFILIIIIKIYNWCQGATRAPYVN